MYFFKHYSKDYLKKSDKDRNERNFFMTSDIDPLIRFAFDTADVATGNSSSLFWQIMFQLLLIAINAIFACAEIAVISMNDAKLNKLASEGDKRAKKLKKLTSRPAGFLSTIQVGITLAGFLGSAFASGNFAVYLQKLIPGLPNSVAVIAITIILSYITLVFGELVPKRVAMKKSESIALGMSRMLSIVSTAFAPLVWLLTVSTNAVLKLMRIDPNQQDDSATEEEIRMMVDVGSENGTIDRVEKEFIQNVFEFDDLTAEEIATHRTDIVMLSLEDDISEWEKTINETRFSLYPICSESADDIIGILNAKDYFRLTDKSIDNIMNNAVRQPYFVPEGVKADVLFKNMQHGRRSLAVVLDEYGGVTGIITMNDLVEQLVGDIDDEDDPAETVEEIFKVDDSTWKIRGSAMLDDVVEALKVKLPQGEYDTFGGFVFALYGSIVADGNTFELDYESMHVKVLEVKDHKIELTMVSLSREDIQEKEQTD